MGIALAVSVLPILAALALVSLRQPLRWLLPLYAALLPYGSSVTTGLPSSFGSLSSVVGLALALGLVGQMWTPRRGSPALNAAVPVWLLFVATAGASVFWSVSPSVTIGSVVVLASQVALYVFLSLSDIDVATVRRTENALMAGAVVCVMYGLAQLTVLGGLPIRDNGTDPRFGNGLLGPNNQAACLLLPLAIALTRLALRKSVRSRLLSATVAATMLTGIVLTGSRGGLLSAIATCMLVVMLVPRGRAVLLGGAALLAVGVVVVFLAHPAGVGERQTAQVDSSGRTDIWRVGLASCPRYCAAGAGWGTFPQVYEAKLEAVPEARVLRRGTAFEPHNIWLLALVESGITGVALVCVGLFLGLRSAWRLAPAQRAASFAGLSGTVAAGFFLSNLEYKFFWFALIHPLLWSSATRRSRDVVEDGRTQLADSEERARTADGRTPSLAGG